MGTYPAFSLGAISLSERLSHSSRCAIGSGETSGMARNALFLDESIPIR